MNVDGLDEEQFVAMFGALFEHSPWVAREAWKRRPFGNREAVQEALEDAVRSAPRERQVALLRAHPELAGREARAGELSAHSGREQAAAALDRLSPAEHARLTELNRRYRERFGFPLIVCMREHTTDSILSWGRGRLERAPQEELEIAVGEVLKIARLRLEDLVP